MELTLGSLCDGIGSWCLAAVHNDIKPVWSSETDSHCLKITHKRFPGVQQLGDVTMLNGAQIPPVDIICSREGLSDSEDKLFQETIRVVREMREATKGKFPRWFIWEGVSGTLSGNNGESFRALLEEVSQVSIPVPKSGQWAGAGLVESEGCQVAWRTFDTEFFGLPQRQKMVSFIADFGGRSAGEILLIEPRLSGDNSDSEGENEDTTSII